MWAIVGVVPVGRLLFAGSGTAGCGLVVGRSVCTDIGVACGGGSVCGVGGGVASGEDGAVGDGAGVVDGEVGDGVRPRQVVDADPCEQVPTWSELVEPGGGDTVGGGARHDAVIWCAVGVAGDAIGVDCLSIRGVLGEEVTGASGELRVDLDGDQPSCGADEVGEKGCGPARASADFEYAHAGADIQHAQVPHGDMWGSARAHGLSVFAVK